MSGSNPFYSTQGGIAFLEGRQAEIHPQMLSILDSIYDGLYITDGNAVTILINRAYQTISGLEPEDVLGKTMWEIVASGLVDRSGTLRALKAKAPITIEQTFRTGKKALITSTPHFDPDGKITMVVTMVRDITELYRLEEKYQDSENRRRSEKNFLRRNRQFSSQLVAEDPKTRGVLARVQRVAFLNTTVLLLGETGVGKELFARFLYEHSARADQSFIDLNCGAIPPTLIESELFGYERGSFTGANREGKIGIFESADGGTVFLDEVGDLPLDMQVHLLRVLQEMQVKRVGGVRSIPVDVRIIAATNRDLLEMVRQKTFREDLYYRLSIVPIEIPPLRERRGDILPLIQNFLAEMNKKYRYHRAFTPAALDALFHYHWPGNVRELRNVVEQAVIMSGGEEIRPADLPILTHRQGEPFESHVDLKRKVAQLEYDYILRAYARYGNVRAAAASLGMDSATFVRKRKKYGELLQK